MKLRQNIGKKKPTTFTLELAGSAQEVATMLRKIALTLEKGQKSGLVTDDDGDVVGNFWLEG